MAERDHRLIGWKAIASECTPTARGGEKGVSESTAMRYRARGLPIVNSFRGPSITLSALRAWEREQGIDAAA